MSHIDTIAISSTDSGFIVESVERQGCWGGGPTLAAALAEYAVVLPDYDATFGAPDLARTALTTHQQNREGAASE